MLSKPVQVDTEFTISGLTGEDGLPIDNIHVKVEGTGQQDVDIPVNVTFMNETEGDDTKFDKISIGTLKASVASEMDQDEFLAMVNEKLDEIVPDGYHAIKYLPIDICKVLPVHLLSAMFYKKSAMEQTAQ